MNYSFFKSENSSKAPKSAQFFTANDFFGNDDREGYFTKGEFLNLMSQMKEMAPRLFQNYRDFFTCVKDGLPIRSALTRSIHRVSGQPYYHINFRRGKLDVRVTIYDVEGMGEFIKDYANGVIKPNFTLDELLMDTSL